MVSYFGGIFLQCKSHYVTWHISSDRVEQTTNDEQQDDDVVVSVVSRSVYSWPLDDAA